MIISQKAVFASFRRVRNGRDVMKVKYTTKMDNLTRIATQLQGMNGKKVEIGALQGEHAWLAGIHEYGCEIPVTPKMRAFLHHQGLHLSPNTTVIRIPERSFLRNGHDENADRVMEQTSRAVSQVIAGKMSVDDMLDLCGQQFATAIKKYARDLSDPPNHPYTVDQKGSSNPLVQTGGLIESIIWRVE